MRRASRFATSDQLFTEMMTAVRDPRMAVKRLCGPLTVIDKTEAMPHTYYSVCECDLAILVKGRRQPTS